MKQPNFKRKALGMLMVPLTLGALPLTAATLDATHYEGYMELFEATDADSNRLFFYVSSDYEICRFIGAQTSNTHFTLPETIRIRTNDEWGGGRA